MSRSMTTPCVLGRQLLFAVMFVAMLLTLLLTALQLHPLYPQQIDELLALAPGVLLTEAPKVFVPALLLLGLVNWRLLAPLRKLLQCAEGDALTQRPAATGRDEVSRLASAFGDVSQRLGQTQAELEQHRNWCQLLFDDSADPVLILDPASETVLDANPAAARLLVRCREDLIGAPMARICPDTLPVWRGFLQRVRRDRGGWTAELHCRNALDEPLQLEVKAAVVTRSEGEVVLATMRGLTGREDMQARIAELAYHDALTGLPNRVLLRDRLEMALARSQRGGSRGVVLMLDTDNFKTINDSLGHSAGDRLLQELAGRVIKVLHEDDTVARLGGDEFVVLPQQMGGETAVVLEHALAVVDQLRSVLDRPFRLDGHDIHITVSVGVAVFPNDGNTVDELLRRADSAMYQAKAAGRNTTHFYSPELEEGVARRLTMGTALRRALVNEEFVLDFQPQLALEDKSLVGCEALVRWERPGHGRVSPLEFLPYLEEMGLLTELGFWVLDRACQYWREGRDQGVVPAHFRMAVNLSAGQFASPAFVQMVESVLQENDMPGCNLELEITEQALVSDLTNAAAKITSLQAQGVSFAIDDFGTGYSSLAYLQQLPVDCLKIDRGFVKLIGKGGRSAGLVDVIISIARKLNLRVVAEGIEHNSQAAYLAQHGCDFGQGYLFGRPVSWAQLHGIESNSQLRLLD